MTVFNISAGERHNKYRRILQSGLNPTAMHEFWPVLEAEILVLLQGFADMPENYAVCIRRYLFVNT